MARVGKEMGLHSVVLYTRSRELSIGGQILADWSQPQGPDHGVALRGRLQIPPELFENEHDDAQPSWTDVFGAWGTA
jgi:hypothetical protein